MQHKSKKSLTAYLILSVVLFSIFAQSIFATEHSERDSIKEQNFKLVDEIGTGTLLMRGDRSSLYQVATLLNTQANISISGPIATTEITQTFLNTSMDFAESIYVFPLPENSAVEHMEIMVGNRRIIGQIMEKVQAKKVYTQAKRQGKRAALVQQSRPNLFKTSVANIPAGQSVSVTLRINQSLDVQIDEQSMLQNFKYRLPLTLTPRYQAGPINTDSFDNEVSNTQKSQDLVVNAVTEPEAIYPPQLQKNNSLGIKNPINIRVKIHNMRFEKEVKSTNQKVEQTVVDDVRHINFSQVDVAMDSDFVLKWNINDTQASQAQLFTQSVNGEEFGLLMLSPPSINPDRDVLPREVIFIIDSSGSMGGESMRQAKESLLFALDNLAPNERFNIIDFDSNYKNLFSQPKIADTSAIQKAQDFVKSLTADGGTNMAAALSAALSMQTDENHLKQIIFITDGSVSNEQALFKLLHNNLGKARLFTVGIGSAPNSYFMRKAAEFGRGSFTYIGSVDEVKPQMSELFKKIGSPILQDLELIFPDGTQAEIWPEFIPDLYAGEPVIVPIKFTQRPEWLTLKGRSESIWEQTIVIDQAQQNPGISSLWARKKIESLMDKLVRGASENEIKPKVLDVALTHHLMSKYTSFVAVDESVLRAQNEKLKTGNIPNLLPKGNNYPSTAAGQSFWTSLALLAFLLSIIMQISMRQSLKTNSARIRACH